jgi:DNA-binding YbaB/EbfC family protein
LRGTERPIAGRTLAAVPDDDLPDELLTPEVVDRDDDAESGASVPGLPDLDLLGGADLGGLLAQAQEMMAAQAAAAEQEVEGVAGGGVVRVRATGTGQVLGVTISPEVVDPSDVAMLEDLVLAALHDVNARLGEIQRAAMGPLGDLFG